MAYDILLANRIREHLSTIPGLIIEEKKMFSGLAFLVNHKMCVNVSGDNLMCRFDPTLTEALAERTGFEPMIMRGKELQGYCYVTPEGFKLKKNFVFWLQCCLDYNQHAKASAKKKK